METISSACKAIWGDSAANSAQTESGQEPLSGETGNTENGEPYDAGNLEEATRTSSYIHSDTGEPDNAQDISPIRTEHNTERVGGISGGQADSSTDSSGSGVISSVGKDSSSGQQPSINDQVGDGPIREPTARSSELEDVQESDVSALGPKALSETGGPQAVSGSTGTDGDDELQKESTGEGTGKKWVKSTGLQADGGDFDAAAPGAGKEADRLMEDKGVQQSAEPSSGDDGSNPLSYKSDKPSLKERIKAKLHRDRGAQ